MRKAIVVLVISILLMSVAVNGAYSASLIFKGNTYFKWHIELKAFERALGGKQQAGFETYWTGELSLEVKSVEKISDSEYKITYDFFMKYIDVIRQRYTSKDTWDRIAEGVGENATNEQMVVNSDGYDYRLGNLTWGFNFYFLVTPLVFFNPHHGDFKSWLEENYLTQQIGAFKRVSGLIYESWDITLGTKRDVYYVEIFLIAARYDLGEPVDQSGSVVEFDFTFDKEYGFISNMRVFWEYSQDVSFEIRVRLMDTNIIPRNIFYYTLLAVVLIVIALIAIYRYYRKKKHIKLVRI